MSRSINPRSGRLLKSTFGIDQSTERNEKERHEGITKGHELSVRIVKIRQTTDGQSREECTKCDGESNRLRQGSSAEANCNCNQTEEVLSYMST